MQSRNAKNFSLAIIVIAFATFVVLTIQAIGVVQKRQISTKDGIYENRVTSAEDIRKRAERLVQGCESKLCRVQRLLDDVTKIPYRTSRFQAHSPQRTIQMNYGDCDDKSNLLISMLHALGIEAYFVLAPEHIFVIVPIEDKRLAGTKGLWLDGRKYYILESTAKDSPVGFPLDYRIADIGAIIDPFTNTKLDPRTINYKL